MGIRNTSAKMSAPICTRILQREKVSRKRNYPSFPVCGKAIYLHHDYEYYVNVNEKVSHTLMNF